MRILEDMQIVKVHANIGAEVISRAAAALFIEHYNVGNDMRSHRNEISSLIKSREELDVKLLSLIGKVYDLSERLRNISPVHAVELEIPEGSPIIGKTVTGPEILAEDRGDHSRHKAAGQDNNLTRALCIIHTFRHSAGYRRQGCARKGIEKLIAEG